VIIVVAGDRVTVDEADDLKRLKVLADGQDARRLDAALRSAALGRLTEATGGQEAEALLVLAELRRLASPADGGPAWDDAWESMVAGARRAGWVTDDGTAVRAHVEWAGPAS
jgi:hypothetical protein